VGDVWVLQQDDTIAGPKDLKLAIEDITSTVPTTALAYGVTRIKTSGSTQGPVQHNLPVPIPGVRKYFIDADDIDRFLSVPVDAERRIDSGRLGWHDQVAVQFRGSGRNDHSDGADHGCLGSHRVHEHR
jgi:hypothetical protein